jgi:hypothetical protein
MASEVAGRGRSSRPRSAFLPGFEKEQNGGREEVRLGETERWDELGSALTAPLRLFNFSPSLFGTVHHKQIHLCLDSCMHCPAREVQMALVCDS